MDHGLQRGGAEYAIMVEKPIPGKQEQSSKAGGMEVIYDFILYFYCELPGIVFIKWQTGWIY